ncbi:MAG: glycosyltransferase [Pseudomonadales bacterium]|nr:glycosyltransferase [Pseudomonadales bacterium]
MFKYPQNRYEHCATIDGGIRITSYSQVKKNGYRFDAIDSHYFYPDGVAAALLSKWLKIPLVITARGTDLNLIADYRIPKKWIKWAANKASHLITVSTALKNRLLALGVPSEKISVLRNGVDLELFRPPEDKNVLRAKFDIKGKTLISVGNLVTLKGHDLIIEAIKDSRILVC